MHKMLNYYTYTRAPRFKMHKYYITKVSEVENTNAATNQTSNIYDRTPKFPIILLLSPTALLPKTEKRKSES